MRNFCHWFVKSNCDYSTVVSLHLIIRSGCLSPFQDHLILNHSIASSDSMESYTPDWSSPDPPLPLGQSSLNTIGYTVESDDYDYDFPTPTAKPNPLPFSHHHHISTTSEPTSKQIHFDSSLASSGSDSHNHLQDLSNGTVHFSAHFT